MSASPSFPCPSSASDQLLWAGKEIFLLEQQHGRAAADSWIDVQEMQEAEKVTHPSTHPLVALQREKEEGWDYLHRELTTVTALLL